MTTILGSNFQFLSHKVTSEQRPPVNNGHKFRVSRVVAVHKFDCNEMQKYLSSFLTSLQNEFENIVKLGDNEHGYYKHSFVTNKINGPGYYKNQ